MIPSFSSVTENRSVFPAILSLPLSYTHTHTHTSGSTLAFPPASLHFPGYGLSGSELTERSCHTEAPSPSTPTPQPRSRPHPLPTPPLPVLLLCMIHPCFQPERCCQIFQPGTAALSRFQSPSALPLVNSHRRTCVSERERESTVLIESFHVIKRV